MSFLPLSYCAQGWRLNVNCHSDQYKLLTELFSGTDNTDQDVTVWVGCRQVVPDKYFPCFFFFFKLSVCNSLEATEISETEWREDSIFHAGGGISFLSSGLYCIWIELAAATTIFLSNLRMKFLLNVVD